MSKPDLARKIAGMVFMTELRASQMLGSTQADSVVSAFGAHDEVYFSAFEPERAAVLTRFRPIGSSR